MEVSQFWHLHDAFTVRQAAALICSVDPSSVLWGEDGMPIRTSDFDEYADIPHLAAAFSALTNAVIAGNLRATIRRDAHLQGWDEDPLPDARLREIGPDEAFINSKHGTVIYCEAPAWDKTTIKRNDLIEWLGRRGFRDGFLFANAVAAPEFLDPKHPRFAFKLAAAVRAWQAVGETTGKTPKQALLKWLREHAHEFGLTDDEGNPNGTGLEEIAKVANWKPDGGAPKTPTG